MEERVFRLTVTQTYASDVYVIAKDAEEALSAFDSWSDTRDGGNRLSALLLDADCTDGRVEIGPSWPVDPSADRKAVADIDAADYRENG